MKLSSDISAIVTGGASGLGAATARAPGQARRQGGAVRPECRSRRSAGQGDRRRVLQGRCHQRRAGRRRLCQGPRRHRPGTHPHQLRRHRQCHQDRQPRQEDRRDQGLPDAQLRPHHPDQPGRHLPLRRQERGRHADPAAAGAWRARRDGHDRVGGGAGWPDRPGFVFGLQGRHRRHDAADRARPDERRHPHQHHPARHLRDAACSPACPTT